ncbi:hypothetical protein NW754_015012 [Fusarium falciforme]|nr:hypothetical protein NW754_015012 [Fusarium falciforme]
MVDDIYNHETASTPHIKTALKWDNEDPKMKFTSHPMRKTKSAGLSPRTSSTLPSSSGQRKAHHHHPITTTTFKDENYRKHQIRQQQKGQFLILNKRPSI